MCFLWPRSSSVLHPSNGGTCTFGGQNWAGEKTADKNHAELCLAKKKSADKKIRYCRQSTSRYPSCFAHRYEGFSFLPYHTGMSQFSYWAFLAVADPDKHTYSTLLDCWFRLQYWCAGVWRCCRRVPVVNAVAVCCCGGGAVGSVRAHVFVLRKRRVCMWYMWRHLLLLLSVKTRGHNNCRRHCVPV